MITTTEEKTIDKAAEEIVIADLQHELLLLKQQPNNFTAPFLKGYESCIHDAKIILRERAPLKVSSQNQSLTTKLAKEYHELESILARANSKQIDLKEDNQKLREALIELLTDAREWRDYSVRQVDSFEGSERQMVIDLARESTKRIERAVSLLEESKPLKT